ncbi:MAG: N-acetyltransferase [Bacteroidetes bacterium]|nr:MAG: N-acetyltransferase [Bacteroidota bacterium]
MDIRIATETDLPAIIEIYNQSVIAGFETADLTPLKIEDRNSWFRDHHPEHNPIFVASDRDIVKGWISVSPYRSGRMALRFTKEISYYVIEDNRKQGLGTALIEHVVKASKMINAKTLLAIVLDENKKSIVLLQKLGFNLWGRLPRVADFEGKECGHLYYGLRVN